jgi:Kdo2-lipid IVA lauroyltransferase/acyltransferase
MCSQAAGNARTRAWRRSCAATSSSPIPTCCRRSAHCCRDASCVLPRGSCSKRCACGRDRLHETSSASAKPRADLFDAALASGRGLIVAAPHYGSWELLNQWLASRTALAILYAPPESNIGEAFLRRVRAMHGDAQRVTQVRAEGPAVRQLFKLLKDGGVAGILPDQQPKAGDGEFAPFFDVPALTMTLLPRLAQRTGATVLVGYCERIGDDRDGPLFALRFEPAPAGIADAQEGVAALSAMVERVARRDPAQYQWTYKRYSIQPDGSPLGNPYWPDCYPAKVVARAEAGGAK